TDFAISSPIVLTSPMDGSPQRGLLHATTLWHFDAAEWAPSTASLADIGSQVYEYTLCFVDSGRSLIADPVGVTDNTTGVAPQAFVGLAQFGRTGLRTIA